MCYDDTSFWRLTPRKYERPRIPRGEVFGWRCRAGNIFPLQAGNISGTFLFLSQDENVEILLPFANSELFRAPVVNAKLLTKGEDVKRVFEITIGTKVTEKVGEMDEGMQICQTA